MSLIQMSFSGGIMILAVLVIRMAGIHRLPKRLFILLWEAVLLRLLLPFSIPSALSVYTWIERLFSGQNGTEKAAQSPAVYLIPQAETGLTGGNAAGAWIPQSGGGQGGPEVPVWLIVWLAGALACAVFFVVSYLRCYLEFRTSLPVHNGPASRWLKSHPLRRKVSIRQSDRITVPLTYGVLKPVILLPKQMDWKDSRKLEYILLHEHIHIRRFDAARKMIVVLALCLHWFNPFVWVMYVLFNRDMELACDEGVVRQTGVRSRRAYAKTLISMEEKRSMALPLCNSFSQNAVRERITAIMKTKKITIGIVILCILIAAVVVILFATSADGRQTAEAPEETADFEAAAEAADEETELPAQDGAQEENGDSAEAPVAAVRKSTAVLQCTIEGTTEEMPATLYVGEGFSMYIPDDGWQIYDEAPVEPEKMSAVYLPGEGQVGLWVEHYEENASDTQSRLLSEGYTVESDGTKLQRQSGEVLTEARIFSGETDTWLVCSRRPAAAEGTEGTAVRLDAIAGTFAVETNQGEGGRTGDSSENPEQAALRTLMTEFYTAYFEGDTEGIKQYLPASFSGTLEVYEKPDSAADIKIGEIRGLDAVTEDASGECGLSLEFTAPGEDSFTYLSVKFVKENGEWKVSSYGLEK